CEYVKLAARTSDMPAHIAAMTSRKHRQDLDRIAFLIMSVCDDWSLAACSRVAHEQGDRCASPGSYDGALPSPCAERDGPCSRSTRARLPQEPMLWQRWWPAVRLWNRPAPAPDLPWLRPPLRPPC